MPPPAARGRRVTARTTRTTQARTPQSAGRWSRCEGVTRGPGAPKRLTFNRPRVSVGGWLSPLPEADRVSGLTEGRGEDRRRSDRAAATVDSQRRGRTPWHDRAGGSARSGGASALDEPRLASDGTWRPWAAGRGQNKFFTALPRKANGLFVYSSESRMPLSLCNMRPSAFATDCATAKDIFGGTALPIWR